MSSLALALTLCLVSQTVAQESVAFPNEKPKIIPKKVWKDSIPWIAGEKASFLCAYVTVKDAVILADPRNPQSELKKSSFLQSRQDRVNVFFHVGDTYSVNGNTFALLVEAINPFSDSDGQIKENESGYLGWLNVNDLTLFPQNQGILFALEEKESGISRKAMLINKLPEKKGDFKELLGNIQFLDKPSTEGKKTTQRGLFSIYYIIDTFPKGSVPGKENYFLLSTGRETFPGEHKNQILGWVRKDRVVEWNTRECMEPYRNFEQSGDSPYQRKRPGLYFKNKEALLEYVKVARGNEKRIGETLFQAELDQFLKDKLISKEEIGGSNWSWTYPMARFPILETTTLPPPYNLRAYRVGVIGDVFTADGAVAVQARKSDLLRHEIEKLKASTGKIQVKFVMDATFGMDKWFKSGSKAVENIISDVEKLRGSSGLIVEFSINFYRDKRPVVGGPVFQGFPFTTGQDAIKSLFANAKAVGGWDDPDAVFLGIEKSLTKEGAKFDKDAIKVLILIGDDGDQNDPALIKNIADLIENEGKGNPISFFAISVGDQEVQRYRDFSTQMNELCSQLNSREKAKREKSILSRNLPPAQLALARRMLNSFKVAEFISDQDDSRVVKKISEKFRDSLREMRIKMEEYRKVITGEEENIGVLVGNNDGVAGAYQMAWKDQVLDKIREKGLDPLLLARNGVQLFQEAWVLETDPLETESTRDLDDPESIIKTPCVRFMWYVDKPDLDNLKEYLSRVIARGDWDKKTLQYVWMESLNINTYGDLIKKANQDESLKQNEFGTPEKVFKKIFKGIKVNQSLLKMDFNEINNISQNDIFKQQEKLMAKYIRMDAVSKNRLFLFDTLAKEKALLGDPRQYWYEVEQGQSEKAWLDRQIFP